MKVKLSALLLFLLSSSLVFANSGGSFSIAENDHQHAPMQGSDTKQGMRNTKKQGSAGMEGCNIAPETGWLGLDVVNLDKSTNDALNSGIKVRRVISGGPAEKAGVKAGDILVTLNGKLIKSVDQLENSVMGFPIGYNAEVAVKRGNESIKVTIKVEKRQSVFGMMPMMAGGAGNRTQMPTNLRPGMFMEDMMKRSPIGRMQQGGVSQVPGFGAQSDMKPGVSGNGGLYGEHQGSNRSTPGVTDEFPADTILDLKYDIIRKYLFYEKELELTSNQMSELKKSKRETDKHLIRLDAAIKVSDIDMEELLSESQVDMGKVESKIKEIEKYRTDRSLEQIRSLAKARNILTEKQLEKFKALSSNF